MSETARCQMTVNGAIVDRRVDPRMSLGDLLRDELGLTGTHLGCEHGVCGACTVLLDGRSARACLVLAAQADGHEVTTVEGLSGEPIDRLRAAFSEHHALQCGFCTPGFLIASVELLGEGVTGEEQVREALSGNVCRCTGYQGIVTAVLQAALPTRKVTT
jgi:carbon-monoxide dehydrogenase small subunit